MLKNFFLRSAVILGATVALSAEAFDGASKLEVGTGYRHDNIDWKLVQPTESGGITNSKLKFKDQNILTVGIGGKVDFCGLYLRGCADYGWIVSQKISSKVTSVYDQEPILFDNSLQARDVGVDFPAIEPGQAASVSNTSCRTNGSHVADISLAFGYPIHLMCDRLIVAPVLGYSYHQQKVRYTTEAAIGDEALTFIPGDPPVTTTRAAVGVASLTNNYRANWYGPFVGLDFSYQTCSWLRLFGKAEYHFARCSTTAKANGNIENSILLASSESGSNLSQVGESQFNHFHSTKNANGFVVNAGALFDITCDWYARTTVQYTDWNANRRDDHLSWRSIGVALSLGHSF